MEQKITYKIKNRLWAENWRKEFGAPVILLYEEEKSIDFTKYEIFDKLYAKKLKH